MSEETRSSKGLSNILVGILVFVAIALSFLLGTLWQKVKIMEKGGTTTANPTAQPQPTISLDTIKGLFDKDVIKFGNKDSKVIFVEISDPSCPYCHVAAGLNGELNKQIDPTNNRFKLVKDGGEYVAPVPEMKKLVEEGKASMIYIYGPGHGNGELGTKALYCANEKGKFWEVHDQLMTAKGYDLLNNTVKNDVTKIGTLTTFLKSAVDADFLTECLESGKYDDRIAKDTEIAASLGFGGTPHFFVNENPFTGAYSYTDMKELVDSLL